MSTTRLPPQLLTDYTFYARHFTDARLWSPYVRQVCRRLGFDCQDVNPGVTGTFPTFIAGPGTPGTNPAQASVVVKFFGKLYDGAESCVVERVMGQFCRQAALPISSPSILAAGQLEEDWKYLIFEGVPGLSIGEVRPQLSAHAWGGVAAHMGQFMRALHTRSAGEMPCQPGARFGQGWQSFTAFLAGQLKICTANHLKWHDLPEGLTDQIPGYVLPLDELIDLSSTPHLIHADLTADHLLGNPVSSASGEVPIPLPVASGMEWESRAVIDWGDARLGNILYELVALHVDLFKVDRSLLQACLESYGLPEFYRSGFARRAMCMLLLHPFPMPGWVYAPHREVGTLDELADQLFGIE